MNKHSSISSAQRAWAWLLGRSGRIRAREVSVVRRGFTVPREEAVARLEAIGHHFIRGYNQAMGSCDQVALGAALAAYAPDDAGFAYEGAAMGIAVADFLTPGRNWFDVYVRYHANAHEYMAWVGYGWALARLPVAPQRVLARYRNLNCWLALDGFGFHEGYFHWRGRISAQRCARGLSSDAHKVFDQGLGRSLWFVRGADAGPVADAIDTFAPSRRQDLWAGVGLAAAYAGATDIAGIATLLRRSGHHGPALAQGVAFAAQARRRAGNISFHLEQACHVVLGLDARSAADLALHAIPHAGYSLEDYLQWQCVLRHDCAMRLALPDRCMQGER